MKNKKVVCLSLLKIYMDEQRVEKWVRSDIKIEISQDEYSTNVWSRIEMEKKLFMKKK